MSRAIPLFGVHECDGTCWEIDCASKRVALPRKKRREARRYEEKQVRRLRRKVRS